ncbi:MAG: hypothetical protein AAFQ45_01120 [Pseudomonadota bacterium]
MPSHTTREQLIAALPWHRRIVIGLSVVLVAANLMTSGPPWSAWILLPALGALIIHALVVRTLSVDEDWARKRAVHVRRRSYERGAIEGVIADDADRPDRKPSDG